MASNKPGSVRSVRAWGITDPGPLESRPSALGTQVRVWQLALLCLQKASDGRHMLGTHHFVLIYFKMVKMILAQRVVALTF